MMKIYRKIHKLSNVLKYFSSNEFRFDNDNVRKLTEKLDDRDKRLFSFDMRDLDWTNLFRVSLYGLRLYVVKDDPSNIPESIKRYERYVLINPSINLSCLNISHFRLKVLHYTTLGVFYALAAWALYTLVKLFL